MKGKLICIFSLVLLWLVFLSTAGNETGATPAIKYSFGKLPLTFIENKGQVDKQARFYLKNSGQTVWLTREGIVFDFMRQKIPTKDAKNTKTLETMENTDGTENTRKTKTTIGAKITKYLETTENTENIETTKDAKVTKKIKATENTEIPEATESSENTGNLSSGMHSMGNHHGERSGASLYKEQNNCQIPNAKSVRVENVQSSQITLYQEGLGVCLSSFTGIKTISSILLPQPLFLICIQCSLWLKTHPRPLFLEGRH